LSPSLFVKGREFLRQTKEPNAMMMADAWHLAEINSFISEILATKQVSVE
jgi:hypothetical protein